MLDLAKLINNLTDNQNSLKPSVLLQLSGLTSGEVTEFRAAWDKVPAVRKREVLERLVGLGEDNLELDFSVVFRVCLGDEDEVVREKSALGLWECDDRKVIRPLIGLMTEDSSSRVRATAAVVLRKFAEMAQEGKLISSDERRIQEAFFAVIADKSNDLDVRRRAIEGAACFNHPEADRIILEAYESDDSRLRQSSLYAMGLSSNPRWLPTVVEEMDHENAAIRYEAVGACGRLGEEAIVPQLIKRIQDDDLQVQTAAVQALGNIGGQLARRALQQCLRVGDEALEQAAQEALSNLEFDDDPLSFRFNE